MTFLSSTRLFVVASTIVAAFAEAYLAATYSPQVFWIGSVGFVVAVVAGQQLRPLLMPIVMAAMYVAPAALLVAFDYRGYGLDAIWFLPLLGLTISDRRSPHWSLPRRWLWPLVTWAILVAISWPIVFLREADFALWILPLKRVSNTSFGTGPWEVNQNVTYFAVIHLLGILFVDASCRWYRDHRDRFHREVPGPLAAAAAIAAVVAIYQGFVDLGFLNRGFWEYMIRASGTLADPNKLGAVAAFWTVGSVVFARRLPAPWSTAITVAGLVLGVTAVWLSGSRTGLAAVFLSVLVAAIESLRWVKLGARRLALGAGGALIAGAVLVLVLQNAGTHTIVQRGSLGYLPFIGDKGIVNSANELLWERFGYGPAAIEMVKEHPVDGVGVGTFHALSYDFGKLRGYYLDPDNAQSWYRHVVAELGVVGSIPLFWWCGVLLMLMFSRPDGDRLSFGLLRGVLIGFGVASLFGMPAQSMAITITFWVFAFWLWTEASAKAATLTGVSSRLLATAAVLIAVHCGMTAVDAFGDLRPPNRAERWDWYYRYGYHTNENDGADLEKDPGGNPIGRRWTMRDSLAVIKVKGQTLKFVSWLDHPDADVKPVHVRVWADGKLIYEGNRNRDPLFLDIPATPGKTHMRIETSVDRTFRPSDANPGSRDRRDLGLSIRDWTWQ